MFILTILVLFVLGSILECFYLIFGEVARSWFCDWTGTGSLSKLKPGAKFCFMVCGHFSRRDGRRTSLVVEIRDGAAFVSREKAERVLKELRAPHGDYLEVAWRPDKWDGRLPEIRIDVAE